MTCSSNASGYCAAMGTCPVANLTAPWCCYNSIQYECGATTSGRYAWHQTAMNCDNVCSPSNCVAPMVCQNNLCVSPQRPCEETCQLPNTCVNNVCTPTTVPLCSQANCPIPNTCILNVCTAPTDVTLTSGVVTVGCSSTSCLYPNKCVNNVCTPPTATCTETTCPPPNYCQSGYCMTAVASTTCNGMERNGSFDVSCVTQPGNEMYLYGAIGVGLVILLAMTKK